MIYLTCATWMITLSHEWPYQPDIMKDWDDVHWNGESWYRAPMGCWYWSDLVYNEEPFPF